jgi:hypothetical protein
MKRLQMKALTVFVSAICFTTIGSASAATLLNGSFENQLPGGWTVAGDVARIAASASNLGVGSAGNFALIITNASPNQDDDPDASPVGALNVSGQAPLSAAFDLDTALGLERPAIGSLLDLNPLTQATEGSGISQRVDLLAGQTLSFTWRFLTADEPSVTTGIGGLDYGFLMIDGVKTVLGDYASASSGFGLLPGYLRGTAIQNYSFVAPESKSYLLAAGVVDVTDFSYSSALLLDNFIVTAIPEPSEIVLMIAGLFALSAVVRKQRNVEESTIQNS